MDTDYNEDENEVVDLDEENEEGEEVEDDGQAEAAAEAWDDRKELNPVALAQAEIPAVKIAEGLGIDAAAKELIVKKLDAIALKELAAATDLAMVGKLDAKTIDRVARHFGDRTDVIAKINEQLEQQGSKFKVTAKMVEKQNDGGQTWRYELVNRKNGQSVDKAEIQRSVPEQLKRTNEIDNKLIEAIQKKTDAQALKDLSNAADLAMRGKLDAKTIDRVAQHFGNRTDAVAKINAQLESQGSKFKIVADNVTVEKHAGAPQVWRYQLVNRNNGDIVDKQNVERPAMGRKAEWKVEKPDAQLKEMLQQKLDAAALKDLSDATAAAMRGKLDARTIDRIAQHFGDKTDVVAKVNAQLEAQGSKFKLAADLIAAEKRPGGAQTWSYQLVERTTGMPVATEMVKRPATAKAAVEGRIRKN